MKNKFQLTGITLILGSVALSGCAAKKTWSPELEQAQEAYAKAAANPLVVSLAATELELAKAQLNTAQNASDFYKSRSAIAHEATLAQLKTLEAEQTARALHAKESLRLAQSGAPIPQLIPDARPAELQDNSAEPVIAAATPAYENSYSTDDDISRSMEGGSNNSVQQLAQQLSELQSQIAELQNQSTGSNPQEVLSAEELISWRESWASGRSLSLQGIETDRKTSSEEPALAAATPAASSLPAPLSVLENNKSIHDVYHETYSDASIQGNADISPQITAPVTEPRPRLTTGIPVDLSIEYDEPVVDEPVLADATPNQENDQESTDQESTDDSVALVTIAEVRTTRIAASVAQPTIETLPELTADNSDRLQDTELDLAQDLGQDDSAEPQIAAAKPAASLNGDNSVLESYAPTQREGNAPPVESDAKLREQLRAMNARPFSDGGLALTLGERYFETGSAKLWESRIARHLDSVAKVMVEHNDLVIDIEAHTDNEGSEKLSEKLTADRAIAIKTALVIRGVDGSRINTTGFGGSDPIADNNSAVGRLQNRRVEIIFPNITAL